MASSWPFLDVTLDAHYTLPRREVDKLIAVESRSILTSKKSYQAAGVQLWEKSSEEGPPMIQLAVRLATTSTYRWLTASRMLWSTLFVYLSSARPALTRTTPCSFRVSHGRQRGAGQQHGASEPEGATGQRH